jgi:hypothetical protein
MDATEPALDPDRNHGGIPDRPAAVAPRPTTSFAVEESNSNILSGIVIDSRSKRPIAVAEVIANDPAGLDTTMP